MLIGGVGEASYSGDPSSSKKDQVRFLIGDTEPDDWVLTDAEIEYCVTMRGNTENIYLVASDAALQASFKYARTINRTVGTLNLSRGDSGNPWEERSKVLRRLANERKVGPILASDDLQWEINSSPGGRRPPLFHLGQFDYPPTTPDHAPRERGSTYPQTGGWAVP